MLPGSRHWESLLLTSILCLLDHSGGGVGANDLREVWCKGARNKPVSRAKVNAKRAWTMMVADYGLVQGGRISRTEGGI